jgi:hypothetical protein
MIINSKCANFGLVGVVRYISLTAIPSVCLIVDM